MEASADKNNWLTNYCEKKRFSAALKTRAYPHPLVRRISAITGQSSSTYWNVIGKFMKLHKN